MKQLTGIVLALLCCINLLAQPRQFRALIITATKGWHHESIHDGVEALKKLGERHWFEAVLQQDSNSINDTYLSGFQLLIFLNTSGDIFNETQQQCIERFIRSGKGYVGIHGASDTEYGWDWYTQLVGRMFYIHPAIQTARIKIVNDSFPGMKSFVNEQLWTDEWYDFGPEKTKGLNYLLAVDESSYNPAAKSATKETKGMGAFHPISWYHEFDGGRSFYTALGHLPAVYSNETFLEHLYGGIRWAATGKH